MSLLYSAEWANKRAERTVSAARQLLPIVWSLYQPKTVVDLGCGRGEWLVEALKLGATDILGIDGPWMTNLSIPPDRFVAADLERTFPAWDRAFEMAICIEVAEHLSPARADPLVEWLVNSAPVIMFSAAVPGQGGQGHYNEDWLSNWARRFERHGFRFHDALRPLIWSMDSIPHWYRQNLVLAIRPNHPLADRLPVASHNFLDFIHPDLWAKGRATAAP